MGGQSPAETSFTRKLNHLVDTMRSAEGGRWSAREIADEINTRHGDRTISHTYVANLLAGRSTNPTLHTLELLAGLFGVPIAYFLDDAVTKQVDEELRLLVALRQAGVQQVAARMAGLSPGSLASLAQIVEQIRTLEGLEDSE